MQVSSGLVHERPMLLLVLGIPTVRARESISSNKKLARLILQAIQQVTAEVLHRNKFT